MANKRNSVGSAESARTAEETPKSQESKWRWFLFLDAQRWTRTIAILSMCLYAIVLFMSVYEAGLMYGKGEKAHWKKLGTVLIAFLLSCVGMYVSILLFLGVDQKYGTNLLVWVLFNIVAMIILVGWTFIYTMGMDPTTLLVIIMALTAFCFVQSFCIWVVNYHRREIDSQKSGNKAPLKDFLVRNFSRACGKSSSYKPSQSQQELDPPSPTTSNHRHVGARTAAGKKKSSSRFSKFMETVVVSVHPSPSSSTKAPEKKTAPPPSKTESSPRAHCSRDVSQTITPTTTEKKSRFSSSSSLETVVLAACKSLSTSSQAPENKTAPPPSKTESSPRAHCSREISRNTPTTTTENLSRFSSSSLESVVVAASRQSPSTSSKVPENKISPPSKAESSPKDVQPRAHCSRDLSRNAPAATESQSGFSSCHYTIVVPPLPIPITWSKAPENRVVPFTTDDKSPKIQPRGQSSAPSTQETIV